VGLVELQVDFKLEMVGSGVVIIAYPSTYPDLRITGGTATKSTVGSNKVFSNLHQQQHLQ